MHRNLKYYAPISLSRWVRCFLAAIALTVVFIPRAAAADIVSDKDLCRDAIKAINARNYELAIQLYKSILELRRQRASGHYLGEASDLCELADAYLRNNQVDIAEGYFKEGLGLISPPEKPVPYHVDNLFGGLVDCQLRLGKLSEAKATLNRIIDLPRSLTWNEQLHVVGALRTLSDVYTKEENYGAAIKAREQMFEIERRTLNKKDPEALDSFDARDLTKLGLLYEKVGYIDLAKQSYRRCIVGLDKWIADLQKSSRVSVAPCQGDSLILLGNLLLREKKIEEAFALYDRAIGIYLNVDPTLNADPTATAYSKFIGTEWLDSYLQLAKQLKIKGITHKKSAVERVREIILLKAKRPDIEGFD